MYKSQNSTDQKDNLELQDNSELQTFIINFENIPQNNSSNECNKSNIEIEKILTLMILKIAC